MLWLPSFCKYSDSEQIKVENKININPKYYPCKPPNCEFKDCISHLQFNGFVESENRDELKAWKGVLLYRTFFQKKSSNK